MHVELFLLGSIGISAYILVKDYHNSVKLKKYLRDVAEGRVEYDYVSIYSCIIENLSGPFTIVKNISSVLEEEKIIR